MARQHCPDARIFNLGAGPLYLAIWVATKTDAERHALRANNQLRQDFRSALWIVAYPRAAIRASASASNRRKPSIATTVASGILP
jgi:hypothetical protein